MDIFVPTRTVGEGGGSERGKEWSNSYKTFYQGREDRALGHTRSDRERLECDGVELNKRRTA